MTTPIPTKRTYEPNLLSRNVKISYDFQIGDNKYYVVESFDGNNEICAREIKEIYWGGHQKWPSHTTIVKNESIRKKLIKAAKQYRIFN